MTLDDLGNRVSVTWGYPLADPDSADNGQRPVCTVDDDDSIRRYGLAEINLTGSTQFVEDPGYVTMLAEHVLTRHRQPLARLSSLTTIPLDRMADPLKLLRAPLGVRLQVVGAHSGWLAESWDGWLEGWTLTRTAMTLALTPRDDSVILPRIEPEETTWA